MARLTAETRRYENDKEITVYIEIGGYEVRNADDVVDYIGYELPNVLKKYVRNDEVRRKILIDCENLFGLLIAMDDNRHTFMLTEQHFWKVYVSCYDKIYGVNVELKKKKK